MLNFEMLSEFSREHCVAICSVLVPTNLVCTLSTLILVGLRRPSWQVGLAASFASLPAIAMFLHVWTWFSIGVVMAPTFILIALGIVCLAINAWAVFFPQGINYCFQVLYRFLNPRKASPALFNRWWSADID